MPEKRILLKMRAEFQFQLYAEDDKDLSKLEFLGLGKALRTSVEAMMDGSDAIHDYVTEVLPDGVELHLCEIGEVAVSGIGPNDEK